MPCITILTAVFNTADTLPRCLDSLLGQTLKDIEIICIDDASTDDSAAVLARYAEQDPRVKVLHLPVNSGQAHARNVGLTIATGQYIGMVDADDWLAPNALEQLWTVACSHDDADAVLFSLFYVWPDGRQRPFVLPSEWDSDIPRSLSGQEAMRLSLRWDIHGLYIVRADIHHAYPYDDSARLYSDDNTTRLHYLHSRRVYFSEGRYYYLQHPASATQRISVLYFESLAAQRHMRQLLAEEQQPTALLSYYDEYRWMQLIDNCYYLFLHRSTFTRSERHVAWQKISSAWHTFPTESHGDFHSPTKFGYRKCPCFILFRLQETIYFTIRLIIRQH